MSRTKGLRQTKDMLAERLGRKTHTSKRKSRTEVIEAFAAIYRMDHEFAVRQTFEMELADEEVVLLLGQEATAKRVKDIRVAVEALAAATSASKGRDVAATEDFGVKPGKGKPKVVREDEGATEQVPAKPTPKAGQKSLF
jgi:hypothetical protein